VLYLCATTDDDEAKSAVAEITARQKGRYERKAFVTFSNMPVTVARCPKQRVFTTQPLPQLEKESLVVQTHSACLSCLPAKTTLGMASQDLRTRREEYQFHGHLNTFCIIDINCCRSSCVGIVTRCGGPAFDFLSVLAVPPRQTEMAAPRDRWHPSGLNLPPFGVMFFVLRQDPLLLK
jgi:hypothetical protein